MRTSLAILRALLLGIVLGLALHAGVSVLVGADAPAPRTAAPGAAERQKASPPHLLRS